MKFSADKDFLIYDGEGDIVICKIDKTRNVGITVEDKKINDATGKKIKLENFSIYGVNKFKTKLKLIIEILKM